MSKFRRVRIEGGTYFFTVVTYGRQAFLVEPAARELLRQAIEAVRARHPFEIVAWVLLPDHLHAVWRLPSGDSNYSVRWRQIKSLFTRAYRGRATLKATTPFQRRRGERNVWQSRFYEHTCRDEKDLNRCVDYVHINPVKHSVVYRVSDWPWSSFHRFVALGEYDADWGCDHERFPAEFERAE